MRGRILIGGASLAGKSGLAAKLSEELRWDTVATDYLARHPGRPWRDDGSAVPPHVIDHFLSRTSVELLEDVLRHYRSLAPRIREIVEGNAAGLVIEGSAVLPELAFEMQGVADSAFLVARPSLLSERITKNAGAENEAARKFAERAELMNEFIAGEAERLGLLVFAADEASQFSILQSFQNP